MVSAASEASRKLSGTVSLPMDLGQQLATTSGTPVATGQGNIDLRFETGGRSPAGALAAVRGKGSYKIDDLRLLGLTPAAFSQRWRVPRMRPASPSVRCLRGGGGLDIGAVSGSIAVAEGR